MTGRGGLGGHGEARGDQVSGTMGIGFQGSRLGRMPVWGKVDEATQVIWITIYCMRNLGVLCLYSLIKSGACTESAGSHVLSLRA